MDFFKIIASATVATTVGLISTQMAAAYTVDFEDVADGNRFETDIFSGGFQFKSGFSGWQVSEGPLVGSDVLLPTEVYGGTGNGSGTGGPGNKIDLPGPGMRMTQVGGGAFNLTGFFASIYSTSSPSELLTVVGNLDGGGTVSDTFTLSDIGAAFSLNFMGLASADFYTADSGNGFQIDNITDQTNPVNPVPIPAGGLLLLSALAGVAGLRRKRG